MHAIYIAATPACTNYAPGSTDDPFYNRDPPVTGALRGDTRLRIPESIDLGLTKDFYLVLTAATLSIGINIDLLGLLNRHFLNFFDHFLPFFTNFEKKIEQKEQFRAILSKF